jgi:molecular chaperone DnaK
MADIAVGIDLGTSNSCVAIARGRTVEVLPNSYGERITASVVAFHEDGSVQVGNAARANLILDPQNTVASAKRLIGRYSFSEEVKKARAICAYKILDGPGHSVRIQIRDELYSLPEISAMVLKEMKQIAEAKLGQPVTKAVITVPAYFNDNQRQATKDAGKIAGLEVLRLLNEPTAAALAYGFGKGLSQKVAIYDFGGGTFDISILEIGKDVFEVLATCGDTYLGGDDFDDRIIDLLADEFVSQHGTNLRSDIYALEKLKAAAEAAKRTLSVEEQAEIRIPDIAKDAQNNSISIERVLTTTEFESLVGDLVLRTFKVCDEALQQAGMVARDLDGVILVGGPTRLPLIRNHVRTYFQQEPRTDVDPDEVVAMGASIHAASLVGDVVTEEAAGGGAFLLDVTPLSLRIGVAGGLAETVIERNTPVPIEQTRTFTTTQDNQERVQIRVYQGESRRAEENELLGQFDFSGFKKAPRGGVRIDVTFEINADGILNVQAKDQETGKVAATTLTYSSGLSDGELDDILQAKRTDRVQGQAAPDREIEPVPPPKAAKPAPAPKPAPAAKAPADPAPPAPEAPTPNPAAAAKPAAAPAAAPKPARAAAAPKPTPPVAPKPAVPAPQAAPKAASVIAVAPTEPEDVAVVAEEGTNDLIDLADDLNLELDTTQPSGAKDDPNEDTLARAATRAQAVATPDPAPSPAASKPAADVEDALDLVDDLEMLAEAAVIDDADLEGIEIEASGDPSQAPDLMTGAESLFDHGADLSRYHHEDE